MAAFLEVHAFVQLSRPYPAISSGLRHQSCHCAAALAIAVAPDVESEAADRTAILFGLPSKGRMAEETLSLLKNCQLTVRQVNPRQYVADIPQETKQLPYVKETVLKKRKNNDEWAIPSLKP